MDIKTIPGNEEILRTRCEEVINPKDYEEDVKKIIDYCLTKKIYAVAANQFGILKRFIVIINDLDNDDKKIDVYFNPVIIKMEGLQYSYEGCVSSSNIIGKVRRPYYIRLEAIDQNGKDIIKDIEGMEAIVISHQVDHLNGIIFTDRATDVYDVSEEKQIEIKKEDPYFVESTIGLFEY